MIRAILVLLAAALLVACAFTSPFDSAPRNPIPPLSAMQPASDEQLLPKHDLLSAFFAEPAPVEPQELLDLREKLPPSLRPLARTVGRAVLRTGATACESLYGSPWVTTQPEEPRAGSEFAASFYPLMIQAPDWPMVIAVDTKPDDVDLTPFGLNGCHLLVHRSFTGADWWFFPSSTPSALFYREEGGSVVRLRFTIPSDWAGVHLYMQPLTYPPLDVAPGGVLLGPCLEVIVGSRR